MEIKITPMTLKNIQTISPILEKDFDDFWSTSLLEQELNNENSYLVVAKKDNEIVGFASLWNVLEEAHLTNIVVKKNYRKQKIGAKLLEHLISICKDKKYTLLTLEVNESNLPAIELYKKFGFTQVGTRPKYYNHKEDAILMNLTF